MGKLSVKQIQDLARSIVAKHPGGIRYTALGNEILAESPETKPNTIGTTISDLASAFPNEITKPSRGLYQPLLKDGNNDGVVLGSTEQTAASGKKIKESDFYQTFAEWLRNDLDEVTEVAPLGGAGLKTKWGTPDVIGVYKPLASNLIKFPIEVISAEVKIDPQAPVVAFGQAIAYRLFSSKTYIAMPMSLTEEDQSRLESLCMLFGVGLVLFDLDAKNPRYSIRVRAQRFSPDMFYVNEFADRLRIFDPGVFERLFR